MPTTSSIDDGPTPEARFVAWANSRVDNVFLTGMAGTGKSHLLRDWMATLSEPPVITAPTGVAALNVGGMTLHRWAGMGIGPVRGQTDDEFYSKQGCSGPARERIRACKVLVIDEISMLSGRHLDYLNYLLKKVRYSKDPFGGIQVIAVGDFLQLPPVKTQANLAYDWAFLSDAWQEAEFKFIELTKNWRQAGDPGFIAALDGARVGMLRGNAAEILQARIKSNPPSNMPRLFTHNVQVDKWNNGMLEELDGEMWVGLSEKKASPGQESELAAIEKSMLTPQELRLKVGALVMITVNDQKCGTVNGQMGFVRRLPEYPGGPIWVETEQLGEVAITKWRFAFRWKDASAPCIMQYPLRLAYALTIHKAQGLTMDSAYIDIRAAMEPGQAYVALSRVRGLNGLRLKDWPSGIVVSGEAKKFYEGRRQT